MSGGGAGRRIRRAGALHAETLEGLSMNRADRARAATAKRALRELAAVYRHMGETLARVFPPPADIDADDLVRLTQACDECLSGVARHMAEGRVVAACVLLRTAFELTVNSVWAIDTDKGFRRLRLRALHGNRKSAKLSLDAPALRASQPDVSARTESQISQLCEAWPDLKPAPSVRTMLVEINEEVVARRGPGARGECGLSTYVVYFGTLSGFAHGNPVSLGADLDSIDLYVAHTTHWVVRSSVIVARIFLQASDRAEDARRVSLLLDRVDAVRTRLAPLLQGRGGEVVSPAMMIASRYAAAVTRKSLRDDRGRPVAPIRSIWRAALPFAGRPKGPATAQAVAAAAIPRKFVWRLRGSALASCVLLYLSGVAVSNAVLAGPALAGWHLWTPVIHFGIWAGVLAAAWSGERRHDLLVRNALLRAELCPSCGYSLLGTPPEADGCTVCPECGSAWRREVAGATVGDKTVG